MKKINILSLCLCLFAFAACTDDNDSNPTYQQPESFVLNTPSYAATPIALEESESLNLTCTQPDYGYTASTTYAVQVSLTNIWKDATEDEAATYEELYTTSTSAKVAAVAEEVDKAIVKLAGWTSEEEMPGTVTEIYIRLKARTVSGLTDPVYSNAVKVTVLPYYVELSDADPSFYFLIGNSVGDKSWNITREFIGISTLPMSLVKDTEYDKVTGAGKFRYTGYFDAAAADNGFKLIGMINGAIDWNEQWGNGADGDMPGTGNLVYLHNEGGNPGHLGFATAGWWQIDVDGVLGKLDFTLLAGEPHAAYTSMQLLGDFSNWTDGTPLEMTKIGNATHSWTTKVTFDADGEVKFRANGNWDVAFGGTKFPFGLSDSGDNIKVTAGTYTVTFNDIEGSYAFFEQK